MLGKEVDLWTLAQHQSQLFRKGGDYYQQVITRYGTQLEDNIHLQFKELPNKTFAYNAATESLELCLGKRVSYSLCYQSYCGGAIACRCAAYSGGPSLSPDGADGSDGLRW